MKRLIPRPAVFAKGVFLALGTVGFIDFVSYNIYETKRKRLTRITESFKNRFGGQYEILKSNVGLLITPCFNNIHAFDRFNQIDDVYATELNFKDILENIIEWQAQILSFKNIPEAQLNLFSEYWDVFRKEPYIIKDKYYIYKVIPDEFNPNIDIENKNIIYDDLKESDIDEMIKLNQNRMDKFYMEQIVQSERVSIGAYDTDKDRKLIGYSYINMDDLSASKVIVDPQYIVKDNDIASKLQQLTVSQHFDQQYDHLNANIDIDDIQTVQMCENMGFKRLPEVYYWIQSANI